MLGVGWTEMLVIGVVALIVIGPKDLPVVMRQIGRYAGMIRRMGSEFQREINKATVLDEVRNLRNSITAPLKQTTEEIRREFNAIGASGTVKPSGAIKPADPKAESVVDEIKAAAGIGTPKLDTTAPVMVAQDPAKAEPVKAAPVKAKRVAKAKPAPTAPVQVTDLADVSPKAIPLAMVEQAERVKTGPVATGAPTPAAKPKPAPKKAAAPKAKTPAAVEAKAPAKPKAAPKPKAPAKAKGDEA